MSAPWRCRAVVGVVDLAALLESEDEQSVWNIRVAAGLRQSRVSVLETR